MEMITAVDTVTKRPGIKHYAARTIRYLKRQVKNAKLLFGDGRVGLIPKERPGNKELRFSVGTLKLLDEVIENEWETPRQKTKKAAYGEFLLRCKEKGVGKVSYKKFLLRIRERSQYTAKLNREGRRAAYKHEKFCYWLTQSKARHGDRPWEVGHIDHTEADLELISSKGNIKLGKAWVTFLIDAYTRRILAVYVTFDPPSYRSCMMILRECVRRHGRLPQIIVVDNGKEFGSVYFEQLLARYSITKKSRPSAKARFGSVIERLFGTMNTQFVHMLLGSTKIMKNVRQVTKSNNPKKFATWTLEEFYVALCDWAYEKYDIQPHPAIGKSPREAYEEGMKQFGTRPHRLIPYDENFIVMTLPSTPKGKATIDPNRGIKINGIYYWTDALFDDPKLANQLVPVRYDPFNMGIAYAYVDHRWIQLMSEHFDEFDGRTQKEIQLRSAEMKRRKQLYSESFQESAEALAENIRANQATEEVLLQQKKDDEQRQAQERVGGSPETSRPVKEKAQNPAPEKSRNKKVDNRAENLNLFGEF